MSAGDDVHLERRPRAVVLLELLGRDPVGGGALLAPGRVPDPRAFEHRVGVDRVDADPVAAELLGEAAREVQLRGLRRRVGRGVLARRERVLRADEDDAAAAALRPQRADRLAGDEEVAARRGCRGCGPRARASSPRSARSRRCPRSRRRRRRRRTPTAAANAAATEASSMTSPPTAAPASPSSPRRASRPSPSMSRDDARARGGERARDRAADPAGARR